MSLDFSHYAKNLITARLEQLESGKESGDDFMMPLLIAMQRQAGLEERAEREVRQVSSTEEYAPEISDEEIEQSPEALTDSSAYLAESLDPTSESLDVAAPVEVSDPRLVVVPSPDPQRVLSTPEVFQEASPSEVTAESGDSASPNETRQDSGESANVIDSAVAAQEPATVVQAFAEQLPEADENPAQRADGSPAESIEPVVTESTSTEPVTPVSVDGDVSEAVRAFQEATETSEASKIEAQTGDAAKEVPVTQHKGRPADPVRLAMTANQEATITEALQSQGAQVVAQTYDRGSMTSQTIVPDSLDFDFDSVLNIVSNNVRMPDIVISEVGDLPPLPPDVNFGQSTEHAEEWLGTVSQNLMNWERR